MIPDAQPKPTTKAEAVKKMHAYNVQLTQRAKEIGREVSIAQLSQSLEQFGQLMMGEYESDTIEMPVDVVVNMALFSSVAVSRILWEKMKLEKDLTNADS